MWKGHEVSLASPFLLCNEAYRVDNCNLSESLETHSVFYWQTAVELESLLLNFVRSIWESSFNLLAQMLRELHPWFFCTDLTHYSRWVPVFIKTLEELPVWHPQVYDEFGIGKGHFTSRKTNASFFAWAEQQDNKGWWCSSWHFWEWDYPAEVDGRFRNCSNGALVWTDGCHDSECRQLEAHSSWRYSHVSVPLQLSCLWDGEVSALMWKPVCRTAAADCWQQKDYNDSCCGCGISRSTVATLLASCQVWPALLSDLELVTSGATGGLSERMRTS